jgi:hypothetical protein
MHYLVMLPATLFVLYFLSGEISAVHALDHQHATSYEHHSVIYSLIGMPIITVMSVMMSISMTWALDPNSPRMFSREPASGRDPTGTVSGLNTSSATADAAGDGSSSVRGSGKDP